MIKSYQFRCLPCVAALACNWLIACDAWHWRRTLTQVSTTFQWVHAQEPHFLHVWLRVKAVWKRNIQHFVTVGWLIDSTFSVFFGWRLFALIDQFPHSIISAESSRRTRVHHVIHNAGYHRRLRRSGGRQQGECHAEINTNRNRKQSNSQDAVFWRYWRFVSVIKASTCVTPQEYIKMFGTGKWCQSNWLGQT